MTTQNNHSLAPNEVISIWQSACEELRTQLSPAVFNTWILSNPLTELSYGDTNSALAIITSPSAFHSTNIKKNLHIPLKQVLDKITTRNTNIVYIVGDTSQASHANTPQPANSHATRSFHTISDTFYSESHADSPPSQPQTPQGSSHSHPGQQREQQQQQQQFQQRPTQNTTTQQQFSPPPHPFFSPGSTNSPRVEDLFSNNTMNSVAEERERIVAQRIGLRPDFIFETFAVSTSNEMAHAAATAVSNRPGESYNPLFLYGGVGVGKTHLMHAIGNNILRNNSSAKILYCTGEEFTNEIVQAIQTKRAGHFKDRYRSADVLLIDDVQFIAGKNAVQEEFFHTFNALIKNRHQVVLTSDRPPHEIHLLEDRLRSRFEAGLMIDIQEPSFELRTAILLVKSKAENLTIPIELAKTIASQVDSARKLEGIITTIRSEIELKRRELTPELIDEILRVESPQDRKVLKLSPNDVIKTVANHFHLKQMVIKGQKRVKLVVTARHIAMYLLKEELGLPLTEIGHWFSNRDHTSVLYAVRRIARESATDDSIRRDVSALRTTLTAISR
jgi:chromosomal replication initiator protein